MPLGAPSVAMVNDLVLRKFDCNIYVDGIGCVFHKGLFRIWHAQNQNFIFKPSKLYPKMIEFDLFGGSNGQLFMI